MTGLATQDALLHITDLHFWEVLYNPFKLLNKRFLGNMNVFLWRRHEFHMEQAEAFADTAAATGVTTVLLGGDFTSTSTDGEFQRAATFVDGLVHRGMHVTLMPGNHDVYTYESVRKERFERCFSEFLSEEGYPNRCTLPGGTPLIMVPTVTPNLISSRGRILDHEVAETAALLAACPERFILVAGHYPVLHHTPAYWSAPSRRLRNAAALRAVLGACGKEVLYIAGHVHRFSYVQDPVYPNVRHLTTSAFFLERHAEPSGGEAVPTRGEFSEIFVTGTTPMVFRNRMTDRWLREEQSLHTYDDESLA